MPAAAVHLPGDIQLSRIADPGGTVIRVLQWLDGTGFSDYEHARVYLGPSATDGTGLFAEAMPHGAVTAEHYLDSPDTEWDSGLYVLTQGQRDATVAAARGYCDARIGYSWIDYGSLVLKRLGIRLPFVVSYVASTGHMICSQLAAAARFDGGAPFWSTWTGDCTPGDIHDLIVAREPAHP